MYVNEKIICFNHCAH